MSTLEELENKYKELGEEIEKLKTEKENESLKPKDGEWYWFISHSGGKKNTLWYSDKIDEARYETGNVFKTKEEAEFRAEQLKVEAELRRFGRKFVPNKNNYQLNYAHNSKSLYIDCVRNIQSNDIYFDTADILREAIKVVGKDRIKKYYFGVDE